MEQAHRTTARTGVKRVLDTVVAASALTLASPLIAVAALWIKSVSPGPIFFFQRRVGLRGREYAVIKFRTMSLAREGEERSKVTVRNDPRVIPGGETLRRLKIDELPQLINVLRGEMSLVGPRPTVRADYDRMNERQRRRCHTLPGLTGLAQIRGNTSLLWPERIEHDLRYLRDQSLLLDLRILLETAWLVFTGRSHTDPPGQNEWERAA